MKFCLSPVLVFLCVYSAAQAPATKEPAKCSVEGQVVQEPGSRPLRKANLELTSADQEEGTKYSTTSDAEGHFKIENIEAGRYILWVDHSGFSSIGQRRGQRSLTLDPGQELKDLVLRLQPAAVISGKVLDSDGDPVFGVVIVAQRSRGSRYREFGPSSSTNDLGEYRIPNIQPGRYLLTASPERFRSQGAGVGNDKKPIPYTTYYPGTVDKATAIPVDLHAGDEFPANFGLAYGPAFRVRGTVSGIQTPNASGVWLVLQSKDGGWPSVPSEVEIKKDGSFEIHGVVPGSYTVWLTRMMDPIPETMQAAQEIEVKDSDLENVRLTPMANGEVRGQFRMESGQKVDWSAVTLLFDSGDDASNGRMRFSGQGDAKTAQPKPDGTFDAKAVPAGSYHIMVFSEQAVMRDCFVKSINAGGKDIADSGFNMSGGTWSLDIIISSNGARLEGVVVDDKQQPVADAEVVLIPEASRQKRRDLYQSGTTDQRGHFSLRGLNPGDYTVMAFADLEDDYRDPDFLKAHEGIGQTVKLDEGQHVNISLKLAASETGEH